MCIRDSTEGLQAPYNNHQQTVLDVLRELSAYAQGRMRIELIDPTGDVEAIAAARQFGIAPIDYRYRTDGLSELRKVMMGVALIYGDRQASIPAVTQLETVEYDIAKALRELTSDEPKKVIGYTIGHGEPNLGTARGPLESLRSTLLERYGFVPVEIGGSGGVPDEVDALWVLSLIHI